LPIVVTSPDQLVQNGRWGQFPPVELPCQIWGKGAARLSRIRPDGIQGNALNDVLPGGPGSGMGVDVVKEGAGG